jgi:adenosylcobinamide kinase/adenosylcobinamide-phosphate guanylyltransferase
MGRLILVLGGARSGKSTFALQLARDLGGDDVLFVATAEAGDEEMQRRIERHQRERLARWDTLEAQQDVGQAILDYRTRPERSGSFQSGGLEQSVGSVRVIVVDCLAMLVSNLLMDVEDPFAADVEAKVIAEVQALVACAQGLRGVLIVVSNEVGLGLVPPYPLGRAYRDLLGQANRVLAHDADQVHFLVAGIPMLIKGESQPADIDQ